MCMIAITESCLNMSGTLLQLVAQFDTVREEQLLQLLPPVGCEYLSVVMCVYMHITHTLQVCQMYLFTA